MRFGGEQMREGGCRVGRVANSIMGGDEFWLRGGVPGARGQGPGELERRGGQVFGSEVGRRHLVVVVLHVTRSVAHGGVAGGRRVVGCRRVVDGCGVEWNYARLDLGVVALSTGHLARVEHETVSVCGAIGGGYRRCAP